MSQPITTHLREIGQRVRGAEHLLVLLDFDGTLAPIVNEPELASLLPEAKELLARLHRYPNVTLAVVSGRALDDLRPRVGLDIICAGNHGFEISGPGFHFLEPRAQAVAELMAELSRQLTARLAHIPGAQVENKGFSVSAHFRRVAETHFEEFAAIVREIAKPHLDKIAIRPGKKILEIRPLVDWNKGWAARWIRDRLDRPALPVSVGDDITDEDVFQALPEGINVRVGAGDATQASYSVKDPQQAVGFLAYLLWLCAGSTPS